MDSESLPILVSPPPARFSPAAKEKWVDTPEVLRTEITEMLTKLTKAFEIQWAAAKRDAELAECHALAARNGTTLAVALRRWIDMETLLKEDLTAGIFKICENLGIDPHELARKYLATEAA